MVNSLPIIDKLLPNAYATPITQLIYFVVTFIVIYLIGKFGILPLMKRVLEDKDVEKNAREPILKLIKYIIIFAGIAIAFGFAGFGNFLTAFTTVAAAGTLAIGFAMKEIISNFVSGVFIYTEKPFKLGDWIEWDGYEGVVEEVSLRITRIRTFDNELLTVPNSHLTNNVVKNPVAKDKLRIKFLFGISYEDDINKASKIIVKKAKEHDEILDGPEPSVRVTELADSYVGIQSRFWIKNPSRTDFIKVKSDYVKSVKETFDKEDIEIPFPQVDLSGHVDVSKVK